MKQKVGTVLDAGVLRRAKLRAAAQGRPLREVIQDAIERYLSEGVPEPARRDAAYQLFCETPMRLARAQRKAVLEYQPTYRAGWSYISKRDIIRRACHYQEAADRVCR